MVGVASSAVRRSRVGAVAGVETTCEALLRELEVIWTEIGETEAEKDHMFFELEKECMQVYKNKVDEASKAKARLHQTVAAKEADLASLRASLAEHTTISQSDKSAMSLKEQLAFLTPLIEELKAEKVERMKQFAETRSQIEKINVEITGHSHLDTSRKLPDDMEDNDLSLRKLNELQAELRKLQKDKSDRLQKVLGYVNEVHCLCGVLGMNFAKTVNEVHPSLHEADQGQSTNISNNTLDGLSQVIQKLKSEKKTRMQKLRETTSLLYELWNLMDSPEEERRRFGRVMFIIGSPENDVTESGVLSLEVLDQTSAEVDRLTKLKASRMKELVFQKRAELEEMCRKAHIEPDTSTAPEKASALIDSGIMDPSELLANIESQIVKAKEESLSRKDIMDRVGKWLAACDEENWLDEYEHDHSKYSGGRGAHLNLKRAERARVTVTKIPGIVDSLMNRIFAWEDERHMSFMYDGVRLVSILEEYKITRQQKEEEKKRYRDHKKLQNMLLAEKELLYGSKPTPKRSNSLNRNGYRANGTMNGSMTPMPRRVSAGGATPELLTPRSYSGHQNNYFRETRRLSTAPLNFVALSKEETTSSFASVSGSEPESPPQY